MEQIEKVIDQIDEHIIRTLAYYDIFNYPLKSEEVFHFLGTNHVDVQAVTQKLLHLKDEGRIYQFNDFFTIQNNEANISRRLKGNAEADKFLKVAEKQAALIARFPFVRAVLGSGSLSKNYMDENSDLDFFIITEPGRLWIARMLLVTYKRLFLRNSHKLFCVNYFVDSQHLEIEEKNIFTATELATVIPLYGSAYYTELHEKNHWLKSVFPNHKPRPADHVPLTKSSLFKKLLEGIINLLFVPWVDKLFMKIFLDRLKRIYQLDYPTADFEVAFKTKNYASKNHPNHYQRKVIELYELKLKEVKSR